MGRKHRDYSHDKIYRIIGGMRCERKEHGFVCSRRFAPKPNQVETNHASK